MGHKSSIMGSPFFESGQNLSAFWIAGTLAIVVNNGHGQAGRIIAPFLVVRATTVAVCMEVRSAGGPTKPIHEW